SGTPVVLAGPEKGTPFPLEPAAMRTPGSYLVCYTATLAKRRIEQSGCGPANPGDRGTRIEPAQPAHDPLLGLHTANQLGAGHVDTKKVTLVCLPSAATR